MRYLGLLIIVFGFSLLFFLTYPVWGHSWYEWACCNEQDCSPVLHKEETGYGDIIVTSKHGTVSVPSDFERRPSQDEEEHVCMRPTEKGKMRLICYYAIGGY